MTKQDAMPDERLGGDNDLRDPVPSNDPHGPLWTAASHLGLPRQALQRDPPPPKTGGVRRHRERVRGRCSHEELLRDPSHRDHGPLPQSQDSGDSQDTPERARAANQNNIQLRGQLVLA